HDMLGPRAPLGENRERIDEYLAELAGEVGRNEAFFGIPADDPGGENHIASRCDSIGIAARALPAGGKEGLVSSHDNSFLRRSRNSGGQVRELPFAKSVSTCVKRTAKRGWPAQAMSTARSTELRPARVTVTV